MDTHQQTYPCRQTYAAKDARQGLVRRESRDDGKHCGQARINAVRRMDEGLWCSPGVRI
jgi:hypothetical protein